MLFDIFGFAQPIHGYLCTLNKERQYFKFPISLVLLGSLYKYILYVVCFFLFQLFTNLLDLASVLCSGLEPVLFDKNVTAKSATKF